jgi:hypothetical protein
LRLTALVLLLLSLPAQATEWQTLSASADGDHHSYDAANLHPDGEGVTYWRRVEFHAPRDGEGRPPAASAQYRERIDCESGELRTLGYLYYAADGSIVEDVYAPDATPVPIVPGSPAFELRELLCRTEAAEAGAEAEPPNAEIDLERLRREVQALQDNVRRLRQSLGSQDAPAR